MQVEMASCMKYNSFQKMENKKKKSLHSRSHQVNKIYAY